MQKTLYRLIELKSLKTLGFPPYIRASAPKPGYTSHKLTLPKLPFYGSLGRVTPSHSKGIVFP